MRQGFDRPDSLRLGCRSFEWPIARETSPPVAYPGKADYHGPHGRIPKTLVFLPDSASRTLSIGALTLSGC